MKLRDQTGAKDDILDTLLKRVEEKELTLDDVKHLLVHLFVTETDTTSDALERQMTELLCHPIKMMKAQIEIDQVLGKDQPRSIQESDVINLPYTPAVVKEKLRLHPPASFLLLHKIESDVQLCGYYVTKILQAWCLGKSRIIYASKVLGMESEIDFKSRNFKVILFEAGRRMCPTMPRGHRMAHLMLATLLHSFNWKLDHALKPEDVDMEEKFRTTLQKVQPLQALPLPR
ncbi:hypothetical protein Cgig2_003609 [Carnegiea gigantea]|uniref:Uncharacterized protein n=1 Tax=Carnegiea gigantea TaxID=171969 RepID=A0A9Q1JNT7_9CARY|nr:hypothetical protein Cgig2_003609 [Carnegiea gigantea]